MKKSKWGENVKQTFRFSIDAKILKWDLSLKDKLKIYSLNSKVMIANVNKWKESLLYLIPLNITNGLIIKRI